MGTHSKPGRKLIKAAVAALAAIAACLIPLGLRRAKRR